MIYPFFAHKKKNKEEGRAMKILVIDDEGIIRDFLKEILAEFGDVSTAPNGVIGLDMFRAACGNGMFDVVFTDRKMPGGLLGEEVVREIKRLSPKTFVVFMSGDNSQEVERVGKAAGADRIFFKPVRLEEIEGAVKDAALLS